MPEESDHHSAADQDQGAMPIMCCVCRKLNVDDAWIESETVIPEDVHVSHGYCPPCAAATLNKTLRWK